MPDNYNMPETDCPKEKEIIYAYPQFPVSDSREDEIDLLDLWRIVWSGKYFIIIFVIICTLAAGFISFFYLPKVYKSTATLIPIKQEKSSLSSIGGLIANLPIPINLPGQGSSNIMSFLKSRTLKERLINKYNLLPTLYPDLWDSENKIWNIQISEEAPTTVLALQENKLDAIFSVNQDNNSELVTISWAGGDPNFCSLMLERVINELTFFLENEYVSDARREREFVDEQLSKATDELEFWERQVPNEKLTLSKITRERLAAQTVYTELRKQLELAKINEAKELESFKVLDDPFVPQKPIAPKKILIIAITFVLSIFLALFGVFFLNFIRNIKNDHNPVRES